MAKVAVVGGGHNGIVAAYYLASSGHETHLFESSPKLGGACASKKYPCGCTIPIGASHFGMLLPEIRADMRITEKQLRLQCPEPQVIAVTESGNTISLYSEKERTAAEISKFSKHDARAYLNYDNDLNMAASVLSVALRDAEITLAEFASKLEQRLPGLSELFLFNSLSMSLDHYFHSQEVKELLLASAVLYRASPTAPGTAFALPYLAQARATESSQWAYLKDGMEHLVGLLATAATDSGVIVHSPSRVREIVRDSSDPTRCVALVADPGPYRIDVDFLLLAINPLAASNLIQDFVVTDILKRESANGYFTGSAGRLNAFALRSNIFRHRGIALSEGPTPLVVANSSINALDQSFAQVRQGSPSSNPYMEIYSPSAINRGVACKDHSVISVYMMHLPYFKEGIHHPSYEGFQERLVSRLAQIDPVFMAAVDKLDLLTPKELEFQLGLAGGHPDHGNMDLPHLFENRPTDILGSSSSPLQNVYVASAGVHPGGLVTGAPGRNAALRACRYLREHRLFQTQRTVFPKRLQVRFANESDLPAIVALEHSLFPRAPFLLGIASAKRLLALNSSLFHIATEDGRAVGYSVISFLSGKGVAIVKAGNVKSVIDLPDEAFLDNREQPPHGWFLEVIATKGSSSNSLKRMLLSKVLRLIRSALCPTFAFPYTEVGLNLATRIGFLPLRHCGVPLFVLQSRGGRPRVAKQSRRTSNNDRAAL